MTDAGHVIAGCTVDDAQHKIECCQPQHLSLIHILKNFNTENGAAIQLWSYAGHPWQQGQFVDAGEGRWRIGNRFTGKMMDLALGGVVEGTWLHQWDRTSGLSQCWALEPTRSGRTDVYKRQSARMTLP